VLYFLDHLLIRYRLLILFLLLCFFLLLRRPLTKKPKAPSF